MKESDFRKNFPTGTVVPKALIKLLDFQNNSKKFYTGHFELSDGGPATALAWFDNDRAPAAQFVIFAKESDGSSYSYWLYEERKLHDAPIVYLGSEGTGCTVMANTLEEFLSLLAIGIRGHWFSCQEHGIGCT